MSKLKKYLLLNLAFFIYSMVSVVGKINAVSTEIFSKEFLFLFGVQIMVMAIYSILWQFSIKGIDLTIAFAFKGVTIIWGMVFANIIFRETIKINNIIGTILIIIGVMVVTKKDE
ncbi:hypothetical protein CS063_11890 [Sporanaerobium hydrogeniformans]|uniref:Uncharacterized protein n=1 Tax=Sporanaerobium hydrogeniformans TaxID=3072179 RepID=A0AC61DC52_9FIRM|nr:EamA family transporter [Sporanaerobium hydrogeniformans]PHV70172.1 hypothetical protein CS063_11890 [Sporanaerobium hydrogeniformans]